MEIELTPEDFNAKGLRKLLDGMKSVSKKSKEQVDEETDKQAKDNDDLVDLHSEKGDSKPPKVTKDDLPKELKQDEEDDEEEKEDEE